MSPARLVLSSVVILATATSASAQAPDKQVTTVEYDIRELLQKPETLRLPDSRRLSTDVRQRYPEPAQRAALLVQVLYEYLGSVKKAGTPSGLESIQVLNSTRLVVRARAAEQNEIASLLQAIRRLGDVAVILKTQLYEVDEPFRTKLTNAKPIDWEEEERRFIQGKRFERGALFDSLPKPILMHETSKIDSGARAFLLSRHQAATFLPSREQRLSKDRIPQSVLEGIAFTAEVRVSDDRRYVVVRLTEKATEVRQVKKSQALVDNEGTMVDAETPFLKETAHTQEIEIADGGSILLPVHERPRALANRQRWWVLGITPRIWIEEEEEAIRKLKKR